MTLETLLTNLTVSEKLAAMDLLWRDLSRDAAKYASPEWHGQVLADRTANPADEARLSLADARSDVKERLNARRTQG